MIVHHFPGRTDLLDLRIREASVDSRDWHFVLRRIADRFLAARCEIVFIARQDTAPAVQLVGTSAETGLPDAPDDLDRACLGPGWRAGDTMAIRCRLSEPGGTEGGSLLLKSTSAGVWVTRLRTRSGMERRQGEAMTALLARLSPVLVRSFRLSQDLAAAGAPARADLEANWDPLGYGVVLLTPFLRPRFANVAGEEALGTRSLFRPLGKGGSLRTTSASLQDDLENAAGQVASGTIGHALLRLPRSSQRLGLTIRMSRAGSAAFSRLGRGEDEGEREGEWGHIVMTIVPRRMPAAASQPAEIVASPSSPLLASGF